MKLQCLFLACLFSCSLSVHAQMKVARSTALAGAKNLTATEDGKNLSYYLVSSNDATTMHLSADSVRIGDKTFAKNKLKLRFRSMGRLLMDEDSVTFNKTTTLDHALVALRYTMVQDGWNSLVLPFDLTGRQVRDAFGEDARLAGILGISEDDADVVEFATIDLNTGDVVMKANNHYLIRPSKEPDVLENRYLSNFYASRVKGPLYLFPNVSMKANPIARYHTIKNADGSTQVRFRGSYLMLDGSTTKNRKVEPGVYAFDGETQQFLLHEDSLTLKAFRSWAKDMSATPHELKFYIDGVELTDGIGEVQDVASAQTKGVGVYDLSGRSVAAPTRKGIYIINGKKVVVR